MRQRFRTSARKTENGFVGHENCFIPPVATKHSGQKCEYFQSAENARECTPYKLSRSLQEGFTGPCWNLCLVAGRRKQIAAGTDGPNHRGFGRIRLDLAADAHDTQVDRAVERFAVAGVG